MSTPHLDPIAIEDENGNPKPKLKKNRVLKLPGTGLNTVTAVALSGTTESDGAGDPVEIACEIKSKSETLIKLKITELRQNAQSGLSLTQPIVGGQGTITISITHPGNGSPAMFVQPIDYEF